MKIMYKFDKNNLTYVTTGSSTGIPMGFYIDSKYDKARKSAFIARMWKNKV